MTIVITWAGVWCVGKYVLVFAAGVVAGITWLGSSIVRGFGGRFGW